MVQGEITMDMLLDPNKYGLRECPHCNGYGSSLKDPEGVNVCTKCEGYGLIPKEAA